MQSRRMSMVEAWTNIAVGIGVAYLMNFAILRGLGMPITGRQNLYMTAIMTAVSFVRSYTLRRIFNRLKEHNHD